MSYSNKDMRQPYNMANKPPSQDSNNDNMMHEALHQQDKIVHQYKQFETDGLFSNSRFACWHEICLHHDPIKKILVKPQDPLHILRRDYVNAHVKGDDNSCTSPLDTQSTITQDVEACCATDYAQQEDKPKEESIEQQQHPQQKPTLVPFLDWLAKGFLNRPYDFDAMEKEETQELQSCHDQITNSVPNGFALSDKPRAAFMVYDRQDAPREFVCLLVCTRTRPYWHIPDDNDIAACDCVQYHAKREWENKNCVVQ